MSEAGREAGTGDKQQVTLLNLGRSARRAGERMPLRTISRMAPQSVQLAKDHALLAKSVWCGIVFSLALVITVINVLPPVSVGYRISTQVLASPQRLQLLKHQLSAGQGQADSHEALLLSVIVLDDDSHSSASRLGSDKEPLMLLEVISLWPSRTTTRQVHQWMNQLTKTDERSLRHIDAARAQRFARWEVQTRELYLKHYQRTQSQESEEGTVENAGQLQLTSAPDRIPTKFASLSAPEIVTGNTHRPQVDVESQLRHELEQAALREKNAAADVENQASKVAGVLNLTGSPRVHAAPGRMPASMILSMLILALAGGAIGGWANHRAQSGGTFFAKDVAANMQLLGLPVLGRLRLPTAHLHASEGIIKKRLTDYRRRIVQQWLALSEFVVLFWCLAIVIRMVLDPLWRAMLLENPLAALGRLFVGLP